MVHEMYPTGLQREEYEGKDLLEEIELEGGTLSVDNTVIEKPYSEKTEIIGYYWSGNQKGSARQVVISSKKPDRF